MRIVALLFLPEVLVKSSLRVNIDFPLQYDCNSVEFVFAGV